MKKIIHLTPKTIISKKEKEHIVERQEDRAHLSHGKMWRKLRINGHLEKPSWTVVHTEAA